MSRLLSMMNIFSTNQLLRYSNAVKMMWEAYKNLKKIFFVDLITLIIDLSKRGRFFSNFVAFSQYLNFKSVCTTCPILQQFVRLRTITYNLLEKSLKTFIGLLMYLVSRSELLLWICSNQYLTFFSRTYYSLTINFQLVFFQARFSTLHSSLLERHSIFIVGPKLLGSHNWIPITLRFQQSIHKFSIASKARRIMNFRLSRKLEDSSIFHCFRS